MTIAHPSGAVQKSRGSRVVVVIVVVIEHPAKTITTTTTTHRQRPETVSEHLHRSHRLAIDTPGRRRPAALGTVVQIGAITGHDTLL
jgi:hypothetical protein